MAEWKKPSVLTTADWWSILDFDRQVDKALKEGNYERISMLYSKVRYPMCALAEWQQRYNQKAYENPEEGEDARE